METVEFKRHSETGYWLVCITWYDAQTTVFNTHCFALDNALAWLILYRKELNKEGIKG